MSCRGSPLEDSAARNVRFGGGKAGKRASVQASWRRGVGGDTQINSRSTREHKNRKEHKVKERKCAAVGVGGDTYSIQWSIREHEKQLTCQPERTVAVSKLVKHAERQRTRGEGGEVPRHTI